MGQPGGFKVDTEALRRIATGAEESSTMVSKAVASRRDALPVGSDDAGGWVCVGASRSASVVWSAFADKLAATVRGLGVELVAAADGYDSSDRRSSDGMRSAGRLPR
jgi:hypothetical protein